MLLTSQKVIFLFSASSKTAGFMVAVWAVLAVEKVDSPFSAASA